MARSLFCWTVVVAFVQLCYEATASSGVHKCQVAPKPLETHETQQSGNIKIIKFDGTWLPRKVNNSTVNSLSTSAVVNSHTDNTTSENISTTAEVTQTNDINSTKGTTGERHPELNPSCRCQIKSADSFTITVIKVWPQSQLRLQINSTTANMTSVQISESWNQTFQNTSVAVSIADDVLLPFYTVIMDVTGVNETSVKCTDSTDEPQEAGIGHGRNKTRAVSANTELLFEAPLLIIGAVLAVIGSLLFIIAIAVWRRYRKERKRQAKHAKAKRESDELSLSGDNYEMITFDNEPHVNGCSTSDHDSSVRKFSMTRSISAASHIEQHHKDTLSPTSTNPQATHAAKCQPDTKLPTPDKTKRNAKGVIGAQKGKQDKNKNNKHACDTDKGDYSEVGQEYEDISEEVLPSPTKRDHRVATPLAFLKPGEQQHALKKTDNLKQINAKTGSLPHTKLLNDGNAYSHLDRLEKLRSHCLRNQPRDNLVSNNTADVENSADVEHINIHSSDNPNQVAQIIQENEGVVTSATKGEEEQDHIYEALGEQGDIKEREDNIKATSNCCPTTEPKSANDTTLSKEGADNKPVTSEAVQSDLADNKVNHTHSVDEGKQNTEIETILRKPTEIQLEERGQESSLVQDNHATQRPMTMVRQSAARFHDSLTEAQAGTGDVRTSTTYSQEFDNSDTNDNTQIIEVKDPKERKLISNYINILPVEKSMNMDRHFSVSNQATVHGTQGDARTYNKDTKDCCDTYDETHATEAVDSQTDRQLHSGYINILPTETSVNKDRHNSLPDQANDNDIQEDARTSYKDADANCLVDLKQSDITLHNSKPPETHSATALGGKLDAQNYSYCIDDDLESYTIIDNIVYESLPITEV